MSIPVTPGVEAKRVTTDRVTTRVLFTGDPGGVPVLFLHGNISCATWWERTMLRMPEGYWGIAPDQRNYGECERGTVIDATLGLADLVEDAITLLDHLGVGRAFVCGNSLGGNVVWRLIMDHPERVIGAIQAGPGSPYGFGGNHGLEGTPIYDDWAGSGGGVINREMVRILGEGDKSAEHILSPRNAIRRLVWGPDVIPDWEDALIDAAFATEVGEDSYPGDHVESPNWPYFAPGVKGATNGLSGKYLADPQRLVDVEPKPPILWIRGSADLAIGDPAASDPANLGQLGLMPGYPGPDAYPPQPMIGQTRAVLDRYAAAGGDYREEVIEGAAHVPFITTPDEYDQAFHAFLEEFHP
ncbi:MAG: alpha/beta hydrolase [Actinobacteria bacterium]|nr:alpha/beta hydrolase [Actinomycetota bacterium]